ncbi:hypothetical protein MHU86_3435 [Fragilaria crotonensis]|nr:hypothetical protein MHU86_3435 [Fragilaria crotonensis]
MAPLTSPIMHPVTLAVSPDDKGGGTSAVTSSVFEPAVLEMILSLLISGDTNADVLRASLDTLFTQKWQAKCWLDLMVFTSADVSTSLSDTSDGVAIPEELRSLVLVKKLGYIVDFARIGLLTPETTMNDIVKAVTTPVKQSASIASPTSPSRRAVQVFDKKAVPTLDKFSGQDEDCFTWRESAINVLGTAGFGRFLDDSAMAAKHPEVAESVFYSLRGAVHGGQAQSIAQAMLDDKQLAPAPLWSALEGYYNTALNRANVVLFDIRRLLNIRLDPDSTATKFISEFRSCLQRLRKNNARLSEDVDTLRALLLVAIQDDDFDMVRDSIVHKPDSTVESILTELRERETSLMMKDQASKLSGDGTTGTRYSRRTSQQSGSRSGKSQPSNGNSAANNNRKWIIPRLPDTWKKSFGAALFKLVLDWRTDAHKGRSQLELDAEYATFVEAYRPNPPNSRRAKATTSSVASSSVTSSTGDSEGTASVSADQTPTPEEPQRKRIRLQKSRRVVSERA